MARKSIKALFFGLALAGVSPLILVAWIEAWLAPRSERVFGACKELLAVVPTAIGSFLRTAFYWAVCTDVSSDTQFLLGSMIAHRDVRMGAGSAVGPYSIIGNADIGRNVLLGARVTVMSGKYQHGRPEARRGSEQRLPLQYSRIRIGDGCWIGEQSVVMASLGPHCTVGAGTVVTRDFGDGVTVLGNPGRKVNLSEAGSSEPAEAEPTRHPALSGT